jgi:aryl-alcohol dehydrogenase-like predicted oxidoreductase
MKEELFLGLYQSDKLEGFCTPEGSESYFKKFTHKYLSNSMFSRFEELCLSNIGFGGYRVSREDATHANSLETALLSGTNVIDTSSNYTDGGSQSLVGSTLHKLFRNRLLNRNQVFVVTKVGYIQGKVLELVEECERVGVPFPEVTYYSEGCYHCIHPTFIEDQLERTHKMLGLEVIDCLLLHNPEYFLMDSLHNGLKKVEADKEYYRRIEVAFEFLESKRRRNQIRYYGISSNTFPVPESDYSHTSISRVYEIAQSVAQKLGMSDTGFRFVQFPANLLEYGFLIEKSNKGVSLLDFCHKKSIYTFSNRPLNAISKKGKMERLAIRSEITISILDELEEYRQVLLQGEADFFSEIKIPKGESFSEIIDQYKDVFFTVEHLQQSLQYKIIPMIQKNIAGVSKLHSEDPDYSSNFVDLLNQGIFILERYVIYNENRRKDKIYSHFTNNYPELAGHSLSQLAVMALLGTGIDTVLVGMRKPEYVQDMLSIFSTNLPKFSETDFLQFEV